MILGIMDTTKDLSQMGLDRDEAITVLRCALFILEEYKKEPSGDPAKLAPWLMEIIEKDWTEHHR